MMKTLARFMPTGARSLSIVLPILCLLAGGLVQSAPAQTYNFKLVCVFPAQFQSSGCEGPGHPGQLVVDSSGHLYGPISELDTETGGQVYKLDTSGNNFTLLVNTSGYGSIGAVGVTLDSSGNIYGTAAFAGSDLSRLGGVFKLDTSGNNFTVLHTFSGSHGEHPYWPVILDSAGNLYGSASSGGSSGFGTLFEMDTSGNNFAVLHTFSGGPNDGRLPIGDLVRDEGGNLYGLTQYGGSGQCLNQAGGVVVGCGIAFKLDAVGNLTILHDFSGGADGGFPAGGLVLDSAGNLYGVASIGGSSGQGTLFKLDTSGNNFTVLHNFTGGSDGGDPAGALALDSADNLYGTASMGGLGVNDGTVYKLNASGGSFTVLYSFDSANYGAYQPLSGVALDSAGNVYGTTMSGGMFDSEGTIWTLVPTAPVVTLAPSYLDFGEVFLGRESHSEQVTVTNTGNADLTFAAGAVTVTGPNGGDFVIVSDGCSGNTIGFAAPNNTCSVNVAFQPSVSGGESAALNFADNAAGSPQSLPLYGTGVPPPVATISPTTVDFGQVWVNAKSAPQTITVTNTGGSILVFHTGAVTLGGSDPADFSIVSDTCSGHTFGIVAFNDTCSVSVLFSPLTGGSHTATVLFADNALDSPQSVALSGSGLTVPSAIQEIISQVNALYAEGLLNSGQDNSLVVKLGDALNEYEEGQIAGAIRSLNAFIHEVQSLQSSGVLTSAAGSQFVSEANAVIQEL